MFVGDTAEDKGMSQQAFEKIAAQINLQPHWRARSQRAADYYDNKQLPAELIEKMNERGQPVVIHNLIAPTVDGVLGLEAKTRTDWIVTEDDDEGAEVAEALNHRLKDVTRLGEANRACSDAYAAQVKAGLGWVEVRRNPDPFGVPYLFEYIHRREVYWDWHSVKPDLSDAGWLLRRRWIDADTLIATMPKHRELIEACVSGWRGFADNDFTKESYQELYSAYQNQQQTTLEELEWLDVSRRRALVNVVYYRVTSNKPVIRLSNGRVINYNPKNKMHVTAVAMGHVELIVAPYKKMRCAWFLGPHKINDGECSTPNNQFPLVPFWGFREDSNNAPYGLVERMIPAQDEVNHRRSLLTWLLRAKRVIMDDDATDMSHDEVLDQVSRADGLIVMNPDRQNRDHNAFRVEQDIQIASQQFQVMQESMKLIQDTAGVYSAFLGQNSGAQSGVAINSLVEQGSMTLAELNDNYRFARMKVGELILSYLIEDLAGKENHEIRPIDQRTGKRKAPVVLNQVDIAEDGTKQISNDVTRIRMHVAMSDIQSTPGYRAQLLDRMMGVMATMPDDIKGIFIPYLVELTDTPNRAEIIQELRKRMGNVSPDEMTEEEYQAYQAQQKMAQAQQQAAMDELQGRIAKLQAEAKRINVQADKEARDIQSADFDDRKAHAETLRILAEMSRAVEDVQQLKKDSLMNIDKRIGAMNRIPLNRQVA